MPILKTIWCCAMFAGCALNTAAAERTAFSVRTYLEYDDNVTLVAANLDERITNALEWARCGAGSTHDGSSIHGNACALQTQ